jgi:hypothetical protein
VDRTTGVIVAVVTSPTQRVLKCDAGCTKWLSNNLCSPHPVFEDENEG